MYRQPIITIMGHIDSGKTTLLDKIKGTSIVKQEAGRITQHIGATEITSEQINKTCKHLLEKYKFKIDIPGLLFIDTPGHNAFDNLRERGGSLADLVVLIIDINKGLQAQDIETLEILKMYKVPFIVAANKIDLINGWYQEDKSISLSLEEQSKSVSDEFDKLLYKVVGQLYEHGFHAERFDRVLDFKKEIAIIPTSAEKGWGIPECILFLSTLSQKFLGKTITIDETKKAQASVLEIKELTGIGTTTDVIVYQGILKVKDKISFLSNSGIIETKIKALLKLDVMSGIIHKRNYKNLDFVSAASGVKIVAPGLDKCIPGSVIVLSDDKKALEDLKSKSLCSLGSLEDDGAYVKTDTLGSLEALVKLLNKNNICVAKAEIGNVINKDILNLKVLNLEDKKKGVLFLFNSSISKEFEDELNRENIPIFKNNIIYKLIEDYLDWLDKEKRKEQAELIKNIIYPCKIKVLPNHIFRTSKPAIVGVKVLCGKLVSNSILLNKNKKIGILESIQSDGNIIKEAIIDKEVAVSIKSAVYLKDFKENSILEVDIPLDSIKRLEKIECEFTKEELELIENSKLRHKK